MRISRLVLITIVRDPWVLDRSSVYIQYQNIIKKHFTMDIVII